MPERIVEVQALTPLLFRDGRPFSLSEGSETQARSLPLPLPSTLAGLVRTQVGLAQGVPFDQDDNHPALQNLHGLPVYGPLLVRGETFLFPAPRDALIYQGEGGPGVISLKPYRLEAGGCDLPAGLYPLRVDADVKPEEGYAFWSGSEMENWLLGRHWVPEKREGLPKERRLHVSIDPAAGRAREGFLYGVEYRSLEAGPKEYRLRVRANLDSPLEPIGYLGGERRPVRLRVHEELSRYWFDCPSSIKEAFAQFDPQKQLIRMVLATPALFEQGWRPGWVERSGSGVPHLPRGLAKVKLRLVAAAVGRREGVSGWRMRLDQPKPVRWMAPAGSVYFFEVLEGQASAVLESWLRPVSDNEQDRKDGFGLALWGVGSYADQR